MCVHVCVCVHVCIQITSYICITVSKLVLCSVVHFQFGSRALNWELWSVLCILVTCSCT